MRPNGVDEVSSGGHRSQACGGEGMSWERQVLNGWGHAQAEADGGAAAKVYTDLDEEECSIGSGVSADVNPCQDDGRHEEDRQHDAHNGAQVHGGALCLRGQVVLKACGETVRQGSCRGAEKVGPCESWALTKSRRRKPAEPSGLIPNTREGGAALGGSMSMTLSWRRLRGFPKSSTAVQCLTRVIKGVRSETHAT